MMRRAWTDEELAIIRECYLAGGIPAVNAAYVKAGIVQRPQASMYAMAKQLGLRRSGANRRLTRLESHTVDELLNVAHGHRIALGEIMADANKQLAMLEQVIVKIRGEVLG